ncbi:hypothetical protein SUSAZ_00170 [Sulfolobus acidocaldarius SUSAZ]|nr:hypothetical protein SUSAZ_00170 [Sulfolobus acidocaldarius SUSAZ]
MFNPRLWEFLSINPFDFGFNNYAPATLVRHEFENLISILKENGDVIDLCNIAEKDKLLDIIHDTISVDVENSSCKNNLKKSLVNNDREELCKIFILNPSIILNEEGKVSKNRILVHNMRAELLWLHRHIMYAKNKLTISYPSTFSDNAMTKFLRDTLEKFSKEIILVNYPPALLNLDDVTILGDQMLLAQISSSTNADGFLTLFSLNFPQIAEVFSDFSGDETPLSSILRLISQDYVLTNLNISEKIKLNIYEREREKYVLKGKTSLREFLRKVNLKIIDVSVQDINKGLLSFLEVNDKTLLVKDLKDDGSNGIFKNLGYDIVKIQMDNLAPDHRGPNNLIVKITE